MLHHEQKFDVTKNMKTCGKLICDVTIAHNICTVTIRYTHQTAHNFKHEILFIWRHWEGVIHNDNTTGLNLEDFSRVVFKLSILLFQDCLSTSDQKC